MFQRGWNVQPPGPRLPRSPGDIHSKNRWTQGHFVAVVKTPVAPSTSVIVDAKIAEVPTFCGWQAVSEVEWNECPKSEARNFKPSQCQVFESVHILTEFQCSPGILWELLSLRERNYGHLICRWCFEIWTSLPKSRVAYLLISMVFLPTDSSSFVSKQPVEFLSQSFVHWFILIYVLSIAFFHLMIFLMPQRGFHVTSCYKFVFHLPCLSLESKRSWDLKANIKPELLQRRWMALRVRRPMGDPRLPLRELSALCDQLVQAGVEPRPSAFKKVMIWSRMV